MDDTEKLLREFVREVLKEDDTGGGYGGYDIPMGGWGFMNYGKDLKSIFVEPFLDVGRVFKAGALKMSQRLKTLLAVMIESVLTTAIPFLQSHYKQIFEAEKKQIAQIKDKYKAAFEAVDKAFNEDVMILSFMLSPTAFITAKVAAKSPDAVLGALEVFTQGSETLGQYFADIRKRLETIHNDLTDDPEKWKLDNKGTVVKANARGPYMTAKKRELMKKAGIQDSFDRGGLMESLSPQEQKAQLVAQVAADPNVQKAIAASPLAKQMAADAHRVAQNLSQRILQEVTKVLAVKTLDDLQRATGGRIDMHKLQSLQPQERQQAEQAIVTQAKAAMKNFYLKSLQGEVDQTLARGVDPNNLYISTLRDTIGKISSLK